MPENLLEDMGRFVQRRLIKSLVRKEVMFVGGSGESPVTDPPLPLLGLALISAAGGVS